MSLSIFYIGTLWEGSTTLERMRTLDHLGHTMIPFDTTPFDRMASRLFRSIAYRLHIGPIPQSLNRALMEKAKELKGISHIWVDKGVWVYPETLFYLKQVTGAMAIHYTPDAQLLSQRSRHFVSCLPIYDVLVTTKEWEIEFYKKAGARNILLTYQGHDDRFYPRIIPESEFSLYASDVCFVGHTQKHYADRLMSISGLGISLRVWGDAWPNYIKNKAWAKSLIVDKGLWGESYPKALSCAKIGLGLLGKHIPETSTTRTFEIPAMGTFLLAERTQIHQVLFDEGKEAEYFSSDEEMLDKIRYYLVHDSEREKIALAGRIRCERSGYSSSELLRKVIAGFA